MPLRVLMVTDSPEPSGVGEHMLVLAAHLPAGMASLAFPDHAAGRALAARGRAAGIEAEVVANGAWGRLIRAAPADLVHVHAGIGWEGLDLAHAAADARRHVVRTEHLPWLLTDPAQIAAHGAALARTDALIAVSDSARAGWQAALDGHPVQTVANGVAVTGPDHAGGDELTILSVGRLTAQKRHADLLVALARVRATGIMARLQLVGTGPLEGRLRSLASRLGIGAAVAFLGQRDDVPALMAAADLLVLPSAFEGLPLVLLEAMARGLPAVATDIGANRDAMGPDHPWLVPPRNSRALALGIADALGTADRRTAIAAAGRRRVAQHFTAAGMAAKTLSIYRDVSRRRRKDSMDKVRLGFIGGGGIAHRHFGVLETMDDVQITGIADPNVERAAEAAQRTGARAYDGHEAMLAAGDVDAVYICVPPFAHGAAERACIAAGLPFFVEKPLSLDIALAEEIAAEVEAKGLITAVGYHWRYLDTMDEARALLSNNAAHLMQGFWIDQTPPPQWWWREDQSGGQVVEQATHIIDAARFLAGDVTEVFGMAARRDRDDFPGLTVPTATAATIRFASGAIANLGATSLLRWNHRVGLHVFADGLALEITDHDLMVDTGHGRPVRGADGDPVWREDLDFVEAVMGRENRIRCTYAEALHTHRVALAVSQSARTGALVKMEGLRADPQPIFRQASA